MTKEIQTLDDIKLMVDSFYGKVREDAFLGSIFNDKIGDNWPPHLEKMYSFWETVLLHKPSYTGSPFLPHASLPIGKEHFERWLTLFGQTIHEHFEGDVANQALSRAHKMAHMFQLKKAHYQGKNPLK